MKKSDPNRVLVTLRELGPAAEAAAKAAGLSVPAWVAAVVAEKLGLPPTVRKIGFQHLPPKRLKAISKRGAAARHAPE